MPPRASPARAEAGFTLVELLVALLLLALLSALLFAGLGHGARSWTAVERHSDGAAAVASAQRFLRDRLASVPRPDPAADRPAGAGFVGTPTGFSFAAPWLTHLPVATTYRTEIAAADDPTGPVLRLTWHPADAAPAERRAALERARLAGSRALLQGLARLEFRYYGDPAGGADPAWHRSWRSAAGPPRLVQVEAAFADPAVRWPRFVAEIP